MDWNSDDTLEFRKEIGGFVSEWLESEIWEFERNLENVKAAISFLDFSSFVKSKEVMAMEKEKREKKDDEMTFDWGDESTWDKEIEFDWT